MGKPIMVGGRDISRDLTKVHYYLMSHTWYVGNYYGGTQGSATKSPAEVDKAFFRELQEQLGLPHKFDKDDLYKWVMDQIRDHAIDYAKEAIGDSVGYAINAGKFLVAAGKAGLFQGLHGTLQGNNNPYNPDTDLGAYVEIMIYGWKHGKFYYIAGRDWLKM